MESDTAKTATEWVFVARSVRQLPNGEAQALGCMARAQVVAESVTDWLNVALAWHQGFDDLDRARQCLALAEAKAAYDPDGWEHIAEAWVEIGCVPEAVKWHREVIRSNPPGSLTILTIPHGDLARLPPIGPERKLAPW